MKRTLSMYLVVAFLALIIAAFLIIHLANPNAAIDATTLGLLGLLVVVMLIPFAKAVTFPGGGRIDLLDELVTAKRATDQAVQELRQKGQAKVVPPRKTYESLWRNLLDVDANIALAGLRIEIEKRLLELANRRGIAGDREFSTLGVTLRRLRSEGILTDSEHRAIELVVSVCNQAVHARQIPSNAVYIASDIGETALQILDEK